MGEAVQLLLTVVVVGGRMTFLRTATFGELFTVTFLVAAASQVLMALFGVLGAFLSPSFFTMNGVQATAAGPALGVLLFMTAGFLFVNAGMSALGAGLWVALRRFLPAAKATA